MIRCVLTGAATGFVILAGQWMFGPADLSRIITLHNVGPARIILSDVQDPQFWIGDVHCSNARYTDGRFNVDSIGLDSKKNYNLRATRDFQVTVSGGDIFAHDCQLSDPTP